MMTHVDHLGWFDIPEEGITGRDDLADKADLSAEERARLDAIDAESARRKVAGWIREAE